MTAILDRECGCFQPGNEKARNGDVEVYANGGISSLGKMGRGRNFIELEQN